MDLRQLLALPGVEEECVLRSPIGFMALHGGAQDRGTDHIARWAAERSGASYYGIIQPDNVRIHLTSRLHDPDHSPNLRRFLDHVDLAISVHGFGREGFAVWIDPERGLCLEPYGPALLHRQTEALADRHHRGRLQRRAGASGPTPSSMADHIAGLPRG